MSGILFLVDSFPELEFVSFLSDVSRCLTQTGLKVRLAFCDSWTRRLGWRKIAGVETDDLNFDRVPKNENKRFDFTSAEVEDFFKFQSIRPKNRTDAENLKRRAETIAAVFEEYLHRHQIGLAITPHGYPPVQKIFSHVTKIMGVPVIYQENGPLPDTLQVGKVGVNANNRWLTQSEDPKLWDAFWAQVPVERPSTYYPGRKKFYLKLLHYLATFTQKTWNYRRRHPEIMVRMHVTEALRRKGRALSDRLRACAGTTANETARLPKDYYFVPFQVHDDSQIIYHSPFVRDMADFLDQVYRAVRKHDPQAEIVVKEHPMDIGRVRLRKLQKKYPDVIFLSRLPSTEIIRRSRAVITINSTVGIEALQQLKPVITLGRAFYNAPGVVHHAETEKELAELIKTRRGAQADEITIQRYLNSLRRRLIPCVWRRRDSIGAENVARFIAACFQSAGDGNHAAVNPGQCNAPQNNR